MKIAKFLLFNLYTKYWLNIDLTFLNRKKRIKAIALETWYTLSVFFPYVVISMVLTQIFGDPFPTKFSWTELFTIVPSTLMMICLFNKDFFGGQSVVHRKLGYRVFDSKSNGPASKIQCMVRNLTLLLWPIEAIFILVNPKRRLGDIIAGTILGDVPASDPESILTDIKESTFDSQTKLTLLISVI
jgi:uncharacterized RDD family membrane protein YckC